MNFRPAILKFGLISASFHDTPDRVFITLLGSDLTIELASTDFDEEALETVVKKVMHIYTSKLLYLTAKIILLLYYT